MIQPRVVVRGGVGDEISSCEGDAADDVVGDVGEALLVMQGGGRR